MPTNKSAFKRYLIIIRELKRANEFCPLNINELTQRVADELGCRISFHSVQKDIYALRSDSDFGFEVPIQSNRYGYWLDRNFSLSLSIRFHWGL